MPHALFFSRSLFALPARVVAVVALIAVVAANSPAQSIDLKLNVFDDTNTWELVGRTTSQGIVGINVRLNNIVPGTVQYHGPRGTVNGSDGAGFWINTISTIFGAPTTVRKIATTQSQVPFLGPGEEESLFYGVGRFANSGPNWPGLPVGATPRGPAFTSLTGVQNVPWAAPPLNDEEWTTAALFLSGTFNEGVFPSFYEGEASTGQVFTTVPANNQSVGNIVEATVTTVVDTTPGGGNLPGDHNSDGVVDILDYIVWRSNPDASGGDPGYTDWAANYGEPNGSGAGSSASGTAVPEPATAAMVILSFLLAIPARTRKN